jgi:hypothetical protein
MTRFWYNVHRAHSDNKDWKNESKIIEKRYQLIFVFFWKLANDYHFIIKDRTVVTNPEQLEIIKWERMNRRLVTSMCCVKRYMKSMTI